LKLPKEEIFKGGNSKPRNSRMQTMLGMVGYGDNAGSGFPSIISAWAEEGWKAPKLMEDTILNQVTLTLMMESDSDHKTETTQTTQSTTQTTQKGTISNDTIAEMTDKDLEILNALKKLQKRHRELLLLNLVGTSIQ
jgi:predicted HTH transcriptional regulator